MSKLFKTFVFPIAMLLIPINGYGAIFEIGDILYRYGLSGWGIEEKRKRGKRGQVLF